MVKALAGPQDTDDVSDWENSFIASVLEKTAQGENTASLTEKQIDVIERIFNKHFSG